MQAPRFECLSFDPFSLLQNGFITPEVNVCGCDVVNALVIPLMIVVVDEGFDLGFKITGQEVVFQQDAVLQGLMPSLDLALGLRVIWRAARVLHTFVLQPFGQVTGHIAGSIVAQQSRLMNDMHLIAAGCPQCEVQRARHILSPHVGAELP